MKPTRYQVLKSIFAPTVKREPFNPKYPTLKDVAKFWEWK